MRFAKNIRVRNKTKYGTVVAAQRMPDGKIQLTLAGKPGNVYLNKHTIVRTIFWR